MLLSDPAECLDPVDSGHHDIEQHDIRCRPALQQGERPAAILRGVHLVALQLEEIREIGADPLGVVDDQDAGTTSPAPGPGRCALRDRHRVSSSRAPGP